MNPLLEFGYVARVHGLHGEVGVRTFDAGSSVLFDVERVLARPREGAERELSIEAVREGSKGDLLVTFAEVDGREAAEALKGARLLAFRADLEPCEPGQYFQGDLIGLEAVTPEGELLGRVEELYDGGPVPNLVIRGGPRGELMVPFAEEFVPKVDPEAGRVVVIPLVFDQ